MARYEVVIETVEQLQAIDFYDKVMLDAGIINEEVLTNTVAHDKLLQRLERLDKDAYILYITGDTETLHKYYTRKEAV